MLHNIKSIYLHRVFHGIRFKVNNEDWLSVRIAFFLCPQFNFRPCTSNPKKICFSFVTKFEYVRFPYETRKDN